MLCRERQLCIVQACRIILMQAMPIADANSVFVTALHGLHHCMQLSVKRLRCFFVSSFIAQPDVVTPI